MREKYSNYHITETGDTIELQHIGTIEPLQLEQILKDYKKHDDDMELESIGGLNLCANKRH